MILTDDLTSPIKACPDCRQTDVPAAKCVDDPSFDEVTKAEQHAIVLVGRILRLPERPLASKVLALSGVLVA
nr:H58 [uncultured bacterium]